MKHSTTAVLFACVALGVSQAAAQSRIEAEMIRQGGPTVAYTWGTFTGINSASLANEGAVLVSSTALSLPGGKQAVVTFWSTASLAYSWDRATESDASIIRCIDYFDKFMQPEGAACSIARGTP